MSTADLSVHAMADMPASRAANRRAIRAWLYLTILVLLALVIVGGATRLTDSGLSITEWKPIHGVIPPLSEAEWQEELEKYRQIPEYQQINKGMSLDAFKTIFWWEWAHRFLARGVGLVFAVPLAFFWVTGRLEPFLKPRLLAILALGGLQGFVGWWMVSSGLVNRVDVSQYRLATHLTIAALIIAAITWVARGLAPHSAGPAAVGTRRNAGLMVAAILVQIWLGALVAGMDAGMAWNTWPLMDGAAIPGGLLAQEPWWINFTENGKTVQYVHRIGAYVLILLAIGTALTASRTEGSGPHSARAWLLAIMIVAQAGIGIATLLTQVHLHTALLHQGVAFVTLVFAVAHWRGTVGAYRVEA